MLCILQLGLARAAIEGNDSMVSLLLNHEAKVNERDANACTPLHNVALKGYEAIVRALLGHGGDVRAKNADGHTVLLS